MIVMRHHSLPDIIRGTGKLLVNLSIALLIMPIAAHAASGAGSYPFSEGSARVSLYLGGAAAFHHDYTVVGIGGAYFAADGIEVGLDAETWSGNSPRIQQVSPQLRFVLNAAGPFKPYLGAFYRRTHIEQYRDLDTVGARAGVYYQTGRNAYLGAGMVQDFHLNCDRTVYASCAETYPELLIAIMF
jgi:hypothetical protein